MATDDEAYQELADYTLSLRDAAFIHQHIVDTYAVHAAMPASSPRSVRSGRPRPPSR
jgi:hypothetical protein